jgi:predicted RNA-binding Zn-ribbon protein involved in translation (DUF1610 family)
MVIRKKPAAKRSVEHLHHFHCGSCGKWWSIGDAPARKTVWFCPWCGAKEKYPVRKK